MLIGSRGEGALISFFSARRVFVGVVVIGGDDDDMRVLAMSSVLGGGRVVGCVVGDLEWNDNGMVVSCDDETTF